MADEVDELDDALSWRNAAFSQRIVRRAVEIMAGDFPSVIDLVGRATGSVDRAHALLNSLADLPSESYLRILLAPETSRRTYAAHKHPSPTFLLLFESWCTAEELRLGRDKMIAEPVWTALGDACWSPGGRRLTLEAARVSDKIVADFDSPWRYRSAASVADPLEDWREGPPFEPTMRSWLVSALERSINRIAGTSLDAHLLLLNVTRSIVLVSRTDPLRPFSSQSQRAVPGRTMLVFDSSLPHTEPPGDLGTARLADALIHEAIHSALDWWEIDVPLFPGDEPDATLRICSPWTGKQLPAQTFIHACFVWAGLRRFWSRPAAPLMFGAVASEHHRARACATVRDVKTALVPIWNNINPTIQNCSLRRRFQLQTQQAFINLKLP